MELVNAIVIARERVGFIKVRSTWGNPDPTQSLCGTPMTKAMDGHRQIRYNGSACVAKKACRNACRAAPRSASVRQCAAIT